MVNEPLIQRASWTSPIPLAIASILIPWLLLQAVACSGCKDRVISTTHAAPFDVTVHHRICGSVAAYTVRIAPPNTDASGRADEFEPFMITCDCYEVSTAAPIAVRVESDAVVVIRYDPAKVWKISKQRPTHGRFLIRYEPHTAASARGAVPAVTVSQYNHRPQ